MSSSVFVHCDSAGQFARQRSGRNVAASYSSPFINAGVNDFIIFDGIGHVLFYGKKFEGRVPCFKR